MPDATPLPPAFPRDDSLCESCGYSLRGLTITGICPECGSPISESDPAKRTGLPWQNEMSLRSWLKTTWMMVSRPKEAYRVMRVTTSSSSKWGNLRSATYIISFGLLGGLVIGATVRLMNSAWWPYKFRQPLHDIFIWFLVFGCAINAYMLTIVEAWGVAWVAKRRGWRVPFSLAAEVATYAAIGWLFAALFCSVFVICWFSMGGPKLNPQLLVYFEPLANVVIFMISILWFETLVWLGVRQVKFANSN